MVNNSLAAFLFQHSRELGRKNKRGEQWEGRSYGRSYGRGGTREEVWEGRSYGRGGIIGREELCEGRDYRRGRSYGVL